MRAFTIAAAAAILSSCSAGEDLAAADLGVKEFPVRLNAQDYAAIYRDSDASFKAITSEADLGKLLGAIHAKMGDYQSGERTSWHVNYGTNASTVLQFNSQYAKGKAEETFTFTNGADARLIGFNVNSPTLITG
jgi:hypothetical protein